MRAASIASILRPNVASMGYALFLAINAASVWGGTFPFLPVSFQTHDVMLGFFLAQSLVFTATYLASTVGAYFFPQRARNFLVKLTATPYFLGWCCIIAAMYVESFRMPLAICGGGLLGLGSAGFYMLWQRLFASKDADEGNRDLVVGTFYAAPLYFSLHLIPQAVTAFLIPLVFLPLFGLCLTLCGRTIDANQPMFEDVPREHPLVYRRAMRDWWRSAVSVGVLGLCAGVMRALAVANPEMGSLVNALSMGALMAASLALVVTWFTRNVHLSVSGMYRIAFPFLITSFVLLPVVPAPYGDWLTAVLYAVYCIGIVLTMIQCAQISRDAGINPVFIYGFFGTIVYLIHDIGFVSGTFAEAATLLNVSPFALVALLAVYLLGIMYFVGAGSFKSRLVKDGIEFMALTTRATESPAAASGVAGASASKSHAAETGASGSDAVGVGEAAASAASLCAVGMDDMSDSPEAVDARYAGSEGATTGISNIGGNGLAAEGVGTAGNIRAAEGDAASGTGSTAAPRDAASAAAQPSTSNPPLSAPGASVMAPTPAGANSGQDFIAAQAQLLRERYRLSARETEIMELIARGNTVARIAEMLVVSENTVRTHSKRIYAKLDIHKKQELIDLISSFSG